MKEVWIETSRSSGVDNHNNKENMIKNREKTFMVMNKDW